MKLVYVHGISKMNGPRKLKFTWDHSLFGKPNDDTTIAYWSDIVYKDIDMQSFLPPGWSDPANEKELLARYLPDVETYLFNKEKREEIQFRFRNILDRHEALIVVAHSLGSLIAYDVLSQYDRQDFVCPMFVTAGSPLGVDRLQEEMKKRLGGHKDEHLAKPWPVIRWKNFADPFDIVAADKTIADEYVGRNIKDHLVINRDRLRTDIYGPHSSAGYLATKEVRGAVREGMHYFNPILKHFYR